MATRTTIIESNRNIAYSQTNNSITQQNTDSDKKYGNQSNSKWTTHIPDGYQVNIGDQINLEASMINSIGGGDEVMEFTGDTGQIYNGKKLSDSGAVVQLGYYITNRYQFNFNYPKSTVVLNYNYNTYDYGGPAFFSNKPNATPVDDFNAWEKNYPYQGLEGFSTDVTVIPRVYTELPANIKPSFQKPGVTMYNPSDKKMFIGPSDYIGPYYPGTIDYLSCRYAMFRNSTRFILPQGFSTPSSIGETLTSQLHQREGSASNWTVGEVDPVTFFIDSGSGLITEQKQSAITDSTYLTFPTSTGRCFYKRLQGKWSSAFEGEKSGGTAVPVGTNYDKDQGRDVFYNYLLTARPLTYKAHSECLAYLQTKPANQDSDLSVGQFVEYTLHSGQKLGNQGLWRFSFTDNLGNPREVGSVGNRPILIDNLPAKRGSLTFYNNAIPQVQNNPEASCLDLQTGNGITTNLIFGADNNFYGVTPFLLDDIQVAPNTVQSSDINNIEFRKSLTAIFNFGLTDDQQSIPVLNRKVYVGPQSFSDNPGHLPPIGITPDCSYYHNTVVDDQGTDHIDRVTMYGLTGNANHSHRVYSYMLDPADYNVVNAMSNSIPGLTNLYPHNPNSLFMTAEPTGNFERLKLLWDQIPTGASNLKLMVIPVFYRDNNTASGSILGLNAETIPFCCFIYRNSETQALLPLPAIGEYCMMDMSQLNMETAIIATTQKTVHGFYPQGGIANLIHTQPQAYQPYIFCGASDSLINFDSGYSKFTLSKFHTPVKTGNGPYQNPTEPANNTPEQDIMTINEQEAHFSTVGGVNGLTPIAYVDQIAVPIIQPVISTQSGVAILTIQILENTGKPIENELGIEVDYFNQWVYKDSLFDKLGFEFEQLMPEYGKVQNEFNRGNYNRYIGEDVRLPAYQKFINMVKPFTTNAYISSSEMIALAQMNGVTRSANNATTAIIVPSGKIGATYRKQASTNATSDLLIGAKLPKKLSYPYLVVYSDIVRNVSYYGGPNGHEKLNAIGYITRNYAEGDFFYSFTTNWTYTADADYVITDITTDIRLPDGNPAPIDENSSVIYKITKPQIMPVPPMLPPPKDQKREKDKDA